MKIKYINDGDLVDSEFISEYNINPAKDLRKIEKNEYSYDEGEERNDTINFVGFVSNKNNDLLIVFPKHYAVRNIQSDATSLFNVMQYHIQKRRVLYFGDEPLCKYESNYPFAAFFKIYNYFQFNGLYFEELFKVKANQDGKISWKDTVKKSNKYLTDDGVMFFPLYYKKKYLTTDFLTESMIYAIDYTIQKYNILLKLQPTGKPLPAGPFANNKGYVVEKLTEIRKHIFRDKIVNLIDSLIEFYNSINIGGDFYFKHYTFSSIWEDMVKEYMCNYYVRFDGSSLIIDTSKKYNNEFHKPTFHINKANENNYIQPDLYLKNEETQLILDAKYFSKIKNINYKQITYYIMLKEYAGFNDKKTISALILPSDSRRTNIHFQMKPEFNDTYKELIIYEEYFDISEVMAKYLASK